MIVYDLEQMPDGKILVGGAFSVISGVGVRNFARLNADGLFDSSFNVGTGPNNKVDDIFLQPDGTIYISGDFTQYNGIARSRIARINPDGTLDAGFNPDFGATAVKIDAIQADGKVIVSGPFTTVGGMSRNGLARLNADGSLDTGFTVGAGIVFGNYTNKAVIQPDGKILLAGKLQSYNGMTVNGVVRLNTDGSRDAGFNSDLPGSDAELYGIDLLSSGKLYISGAFAGYDSVRRLNSDGTTDTGFNIDNDTNGARVWAVTEQSDGKVLACGEFGGFTIGGVFKLGRRIFRFNSDGSADATFTAQIGNSFSSDVLRVITQQTDGKILFGGDFSLVNGVLGHGLKRIDTNSNIDNSFFGFIGRFVTPGVAAVAPDGKIYVGGNFDVMGLTIRPYLVRLNPDGSVDNTFVPAPELNNPVYTITLAPDGKVFVGGYSGDNFFPGSVGRGIWKLNNDGSLDTGFNAHISTLEIVRTIVVQPDGKVLIGGSFSNVNEVARTKIARLNTDGTLDAAFNPVFAALNVNKIALDAAGNILSGGNFSHVNGVPTANIVRLKPDGTTDAVFNIGTGTNNPVNAIYIDETGSIFIGGGFSTYRGTSTGSIVKVKSDGTIDASFKKVRITNSTTYAIVPLPNKKLLISGNGSSQIDASPRRKIFRLLSNGAIDFAFDAGLITQGGNSGINTLVDGLAVQPDGHILATGNFDAVDGIPRWGLVRMKNNQRIPPPMFDYEGDGKSDVTVFRPSTGVWYRINSYLNQIRAYQFGSMGDKPVPADFDGDFRTDIAVFRPSEGAWYIQNSSDDSFSILSFGISEDIPVAADFDGDGKADIAVFRPSTGVWYILRSQLGLQAVQFGLTGDRPAAADFDGDGVADIAVFRPSTGAWYLINSSNGNVSATAFGLNGDIPVQGDYDGDFKADVAVFRPSNGVWYLLTSSQGFQAAQFGINGDKPVPADYDGDGKIDIAVYRSGTWYILFSTGGFTAFNFGASEDIPQRYRPD